MIGNTHIFFWALGLLGVRDKKQGGIWYDHGLGLWHLMPLSTIFQLYRIWVIFKKMKTLCDIEGEISNWTN